MPDKLKVSKAITFVNDYVDTKKMMEYLSVSDICLTPYRDPDQAASGTLAYGIGSGLVIISTPYRYAKELLARKRGFLVDFEDYNAMADVVNKLIDDPKLRNKTMRSIKRYCRSMDWSVVGKDYLKLIKKYSV